MPNILIDTGVWYSFCDHRDRAGNREEVDALFELIKPHKIILPWPVAYETVRTRFARNRIAMEIFEREIKSPSVILIDDSDYRETALDLAFSSSKRGRALSLVDCLMRLFMDDVNVKIDHFATFNNGDFFDVCAKRGIELIP